MKKYIQITFVLGIFAVFVLLRQFKGSDENPVTPISQQNSNSTSRTTQTSSNSSQNIYKDGTYTGIVADAFYGNLQVQAVIQGGRLSDIVFLEYPNDNPTSRSINQQASVLLKEEAIRAQNSQVDIVTGASDSSRAFQQSLASALAQAK